jgi:hypothetical protein
MTDVVVGSVDEIPVGEGRTFAVGGEQIAVFRLSLKPWIGDFVASRGCFLHGWGGSGWCGHE